MSPSEEKAPSTVVRLLRQYGVYVMVGLAVTLASVLLRQALGWVIPDESPTGYQATIVGAYLLGVPLSLLAHRTTTFRDSGGLSPSAVGAFCLIHALGLAMNLVVSTCLRGVLIDLLGNEATKPIAFGSAALIVSVMTFALKKTLVFHGATTPT